MSHIVFWAEPDVIEVDGDYVTTGAGEVEGGESDGQERIALVIHSGVDDFAHVHLTSEQAKRLIESLTGSCAALDETPDGAA